MFDYVAANFADMEVHCSTQMGVDDLEGTMLLKEMGADRVVLAREVDLADVKKSGKLQRFPSRCLFTVRCVFPTPETALCPA